MDDKMKRRPNEISLSRVKTIMKSSPDVENVSQESVFAVTKATEMFIKHMVTEAYKASGNVKTLEYKHVSNLVQSSNELAFLREIVPRKVTLREIKEYQRQRGLKVEEPGDTSPLGSISDDEDDDEVNDESIKNMSKDNDSDVSVNVEDLDETPDDSEASSPTPKTSRQDTSSNVVSSTTPDVSVLSELNRSPGVKRGTDSGESYSPSSKKSSTDSVVNRRKSLNKECENDELIDTAPKSDTNGIALEPVGSPRSVDSMSTGSRTPSPSPSYSSLSPEPSVIVHADADVVSVHSSDCEGIY